MTYKTIVIDYAPKAKKMAAAIEKTANEKAPGRLGAGDLFRDKLRQGDFGVPYAGERPAGEAI